MAENFLERLRAADERVKRRVAVFLSAVATVVVLMVWLAYLNSIVRPAPAAPGAEKMDENFSLVGVVRSGIASVAEGARDAVSALGRVFVEGRSYRVTP